MARNPGSYGSFVQSAHCWSLYGRHQGPCLHCLLLDTDESSENLAIDSVLPIIVGQTAQTESRYFLAGCAALSSFVRFVPPQDRSSIITARKASRGEGKSVRLLWFNPLSILGLFRWPNICAIVSPVRDQAMKAHKIRHLFPAVQCWRHITSSYL